MKKRELLLTGLIFLGLLAGLVVGQLVLFDPGATPEALAESARPWSDIGSFIFIRPLKMLIVPLVFVSVVVGVASIGNPQRLGLVGGATLVYYLTTMLLAVGLGLLLVSTIKPGAGVENPEVFIESGRAGFESAREVITAGSAEGVGGAFSNLVDRMIPANPVLAAVEGNTLGLVVFAILLGLALVLTGPRAKPAVDVFEALFAAFITLVTWIIWIAPLGVFFLVAGRIGEIGLGQLAGPVLKYMLTVLAGLGIHAFITLPVILFLATRINPFGYLWALRKPFITAFSTASSAATLPITIEECERRGGCSRRAANFVLPLGATVNMDGTALYQAVAVVFLFQMYGLDLSLGQQLIILITATLAAVGTAAIPSAGLVTMAIVIAAVNSSLRALGEGFQLPLEAIAIILGIDRLLDMCRTAVNVWGDATGARIVTRLAPDTDDEKQAAYA